MSSLVWIWHERYTWTSRSGLDETAMTMRIMKLPFIIRATFCDRWPTLMVRRR